MVDGKFHQSIILFPHEIKSCLEPLQKPRDEAGPRGFPGFLRRVMQPVGGHHRRQRIGGHSGERQRERDGQAELLEILADNLAHRTDRHENRHQGHGRCENRQHQLFCRISSCQHRLFAHLDMAEHVLDEHDSVVNQEAHRQRKPHQRHIVQRKIHQPHQIKRRDNGSRNGEAANDGGPQILQKQIGDG